MYYAHKTFSFSSSRSYKLLRKKFQSSYIFIFFARTKLYTAELFSMASQWHDSKLLVTLVVSAHSIGFAAQAILYQILCRTSYYTHSTHNLWPPLLLIWLGARGGLDIVLQAVVFLPCALAGLFPASIWLLMFVTRWSAAAVLRCVVLPHQPNHHV